MTADNKKTAGLRPAAEINTQEHNHKKEAKTQGQTTQPNSAHDAAETDKTDETYNVSNHDFLCALFGDRPGEIRPVIVSFKGSPQAGSQSKWFGHGWTPETPITAEGNNNYFSLSAYRPDESGTYRRRKTQFSALHAVMLDDIGGKIGRERLTLPPSWMLETSPGNYQAGYILDEPLQDSKQADALVNAIIAAGLCDPGASGPTARLARLPVASNGKHDPAFPCRLEEWQPELRYGVYDLVNGLSLDIKDTSRPKRERKERAERPDTGDEIFIPRPEENSVIAALKNKGLYKSPLGGDKHDITCPWVNEHMDGIDGGTAYFEPNDVYPIGGFKCLHGHCAQRHVRDLLQYLGIEPSAARMKPKIRCIGGEIHRIADRAEQELANPGLYYQRGGLIVTITTDPGTRETFVKPLSPPALVKALASVAEWERFDMKCSAWVRIDPPARTVSVVHDATDYRHLPVLNGIAHQPYLRPDLTLSTDAGYDSATGMYGVFDSRKFKVPDAPTKEQAQAALDMIAALLSEFSFAKDTDKAAALSAILTATIRPSLTVAPMYHYRAPQIGSGKSFLCQITGTFATPRRSAPTSFPHDDEECRKLLLSELLRAPAVIEFDNLTSDLIPHKSLCTALTSEFLTGRILGVSKTATVSTRALFLSSGNNVGPIQDMARRCLTITLDPACETPASRTFKNPNVFNDLCREREKYVSAALTVIRAWIVAGKPMADCKPLNSYEEWSDLCRQPLLWLGLPDPTESVFAAMNDDPDRETLGRLMQAWREIFGTTPKMIRDAVNLAGYGNDELKEAMQDIAGERDGSINRRSLGHWIKRNANRPVDGLRFVPVSGSRSAAAYRVESVSSVLSVSEG